MACKLCRHKAREEIDKMIIAGVPYSRIKSKFRIKSDSMISYHKGTCLGLIPPPRRRAYPKERPW
jgi:cell division protein YceG involved in septum cleavage